MGRGVCGQVWSRDGYWERVPRGKLPNPRVKGHLLCPVLFTHGSTPSTRVSLGSRDPISETGEVPFWWKTPVPDLPSWISVVPFRGKAPTRGSSFPSPRHTGGPPSPGLRTLVCGEVHIGVCLRSSGSRGESGEGMWDWPVTACGWVSCGGRYPHTSPQRPSHL